MKYTKKIASLIVDMVATGDHTIAAICSHVGIHPDTYYDWKKNKPDFSDALKKAEERRLDALGALAQSGLATLLTKHEYEEVTIEYENDKDNKPKIKSQKKVRKFIMPNATAVIFALTNRKSESWKQKQNIEHTGKDGETLNPVVTIVNTGPAPVSSEKDIDLD